MQYLILIIRKVERAQVINCIGHGGRVLNYFKAMIFNFKIKKRYINNFYLK
jgi:hypothetical protein